MQTLNLPTYSPKISRKGGKTYIYDPMRRKDVVLTPEEWVRQHFVNYLVSEKSYPAARIANEVSITVNNTSKRCDTVVYGDFMDPLAIVEYKSPDTLITEAVFNQIMRYNMALRVPCLIVSNGLSHYCCRIDYASMRCDFLQEIPAYDEL